MLRNDTVKPCVCAWKEQERGGRVAKPGSGIAVGICATAVFTEVVVGTTVTGEGVRLAVGRAALCRLTMLKTINKPASTMTTPAPMSASIGLVISRPSIA